MEQIRKESFRTVVFQIIGIIIGFINQVFIFSNLLSVTVVGLIKLIQSVSVIICEVSELNLTNLSIKFFPYFKDGKKNNGFLFFPLVIATIWFSVVVFIICVFKETLIVKYEDSELFIKYFNLVFPLSYGILLTLIFGSYLQVLLRISFVSFSKDIIHRILLILLVILFYYEWFNMTSFLMLFVLLYYVPAVLMVGYLILIGNFNIVPNFKIINKKLLKSVGSFTFYTLLANILVRLVLEIDKVMIASIRGLADTGIYGIASLFASVIMIPKQSISRISNPIISEAHLKNDLKTIKGLYKKTSIIQFVISCYLFMIIWFNVDDILSFIPKDYSEGKYVILMIALMHLIDASSGVVGGILLYSRYYKYVFYFNIFLLILTIGTNYLFIPIYGINGAAMATSFSFLLLVFFRIIFVYNKFNIHPYSFSTIKVILISIIVYMVVYSIPTIEVNYINIIIKSLIATVLYSILIYKLKISLDINDYAIKIWQNLLKGVNII